MHEAGFVLARVSAKSSALDKLLGRLGTYATWLSSMRTCENNWVFSYFFFTQRFFFCD